LLLHHDKAPAHSSLLIRDFFHKTWDDSRPPPSILARPSTTGLLSLQQMRNPYWKGDDLSLTRRSNKIHWQNYTVLQKGNSRNASKTRRNADSNVRKIYESTSKVTNLHSSKLSQKTSYLHCLMFVPCIDGLCIEKPTLCTMFH
jgi:hypothetical protein